MTDPTFERRRFLLWSAGLMGGLAVWDGLAPTFAVPGEGASGDHLGRGLTDTSASPHVAVRSIGLGEVRWTRGFWADRFETCREAMVPNLARIMEGTGRSQFAQNFQIAA